MGMAKGQGFVERSSDEQLAITRVILKEKLEKMYGRTPTRQAVDIAFEFYAIGVDDAQRALLCYMDILASKRK